MPFDPTKPVRTRDGRPARIAVTDLKHPTARILGIVDLGDFEAVYFYADSGKLFAFATKEDPLDLVNIPEEHHVYVNVYDDNAVGHPAPALAIANRRAKGRAVSRTSVAKLTIVDGKAVSVETVSEDD